MKPDSSLEIIKIPTSTPYTDEQAQDAVGSILLDTSTIDFTYNDSIPSISAVLIGFGSLTTTNLSEGSNLYFTDERAQDAIGTILVDSSTIDFTYSDATPSITATVITGTSGATIPLLNGNNTHSGTNTFTGETSGTKLAITFSLSTSGLINSDTINYLKSGEVVCTSSRGVIMPRAGSITAITYHWDWTAVAGADSIVADVRKNGTSVLQLNLGTTSAANQAARTTQARNTDTFVAGDELAVSFTPTSESGSNLGTMTNIISLIEVYFD